MNRMVLGVRAAAVLLAALVVGCGGGDGGGGKQPEKQKTVPARGIVMFKGKPLKDAFVSFQALDGKVAAHGTSDGVGSFTLTTYTKDDGAPPGRYKVTVAVNTAKEIEPGVLAPEPEGGFKSPIPTKYSNPATTDILKEVKEDGKNDFTIEIP